ncbi:MAG: TonB-dependent receptor domain-containing protein [Candidatus Baltobacteraceae bacterium]
MFKSRLFFLAVIALLLTAGAPQASLAQTAAQVSVTGRVSDENDSPIAGADVSLRGPSRQHTTTDAAGAFTLNGLTPGIYVLAVYKAGYASAVQNDVTLLGGQTTSLAVRLQRQTFSSLRTIASVRTNGRGINTTPASVDVVTNQTFVDQAQPQVTRVLSQIPGIQISFPSNSANAAAPGSITVPNIRAATSYETASLIDGHPISVGQYGDNVTTFLNSFMFGSVEVVKGPGADAPEVNNAIGGTVNFRTKDPTIAPLAQFVTSLDTRGGSFTNFGFSDTVGRFGFVIDAATNDNPSALSGKNVYYDPSYGAVPAGVLNGNASGTQVGNTASNLTTQYPLIACCFTLFGNLDQTAELFKVRYRLSPATTFTASYLGSQTVSDQNGNTSAFIRSQFTPGPGYTGSLPAGPIDVANVYPGGFSGEFNNEPIVQGELTSTLGKGTLLARYYKATISRYQYQGGTPDQLDYNAVKLYGTSTADPVNVPGSFEGTFNGSGANVGYATFYREPELDKLTGGSFEYQLPILDNDMISFSAEQTAAQTIDYVELPGPSYQLALPPGTSQLLSTYLLRGHFYLGRKLELTLANYFNTYSSTYAVDCAGGCTDDSARFGTGVIFNTTRNRHDDPRVGLVFHANPSTAVRFAAGSSIAPPFMGLLSQIASPPSFNGNVAIESESNGNLRPETGFGYDLGADVRLRDATIVSGDVYLTNLFNRFFGQTVNSGLVCGTANPCTGGAPNGTPILNQTNTNISNARFEGIELTVRRQPSVGLGYNLSGALQKGYYYNLPPYFYCSVPGPGCTYDQNLNVLAGQNTNGIPVGFYNISYNGNMRIPYAQGNGEISYTFRNKAYAEFGATYYGNNNSLNEPPFFIGYATLRYPLSNAIALQVSGDNIFNRYPGYLPVLGAGVPIGLANGQTGATTGNVLGPSTWRLVLSTRLP